MEPGRYYHIFNRGNNREKILFEEENYRYFLERFDYNLFEFVDVFAYCFMPNHFHFFVRVKEHDESLPKKTIQNAFKNFFISYAKSINTKHNRSGSLFQAKCKKKEFTRDSDFCSIIRYIHRNPVEAGLCKNCSDWKYSSYNAFISHKPTKIKIQEVIDWFVNKSRFIEAHEEKDITDIPVKTSEALRDFGSQRLI